MSKRRKIITISLSSFFLLVIALILFAVLSPWPTIWIARSSFAKDAKKNFIERTNIDSLNVTVSEELSYDLEAKKSTRSTFNIIYPNDNANNLPIIIFVHGGAFIAGDKSDNQNYLMKLSSEGYIIFNINYGLAPDNKYPTALIQLSKMYRYVLSNELTLENQFNIEMDANTIFLGGDSAGANIVSLFALIETNPNYISQTEVLKAHKEEFNIPGINIKGIFLFCGAYDLNAFKSFTGGLKFVVNHIGRGLTGKWDWQKSNVVNEMSLFIRESDNNYKHYITSDYPPVYITDGSETASFSTQGKTFATLLKDVGIDVTGKFYPELRHEFQFMLENVDSDNNLSYDEKQKIDNCVIAANEVFTNVVSFLNTPK